MNRPHALATLHQLTLSMMAVSLTVLSACVSRPAGLAPVENRAETPSQTVISQHSAWTVTSAKAAIDPYAVSAEQTGYYTVKPGDTLLQIGRNTGQNAWEIAQWNNISNPNQIEVGQVLRVAPPGMNALNSGANGVISTPVTSGTGAMTSAPVPAPAGASATPVVLAPAASNTPANNLSNVPNMPNMPNASAVKPLDSIDFIWPTNGALIAGFDEIKSKGLKFAGRAGEPVFAAADARVVYAGSGLRGYGNLVILKHNDTYLTAYAHNQALLVQEEQVVRKGQRIADMGNTDADRVMLHFEIRKNGKPVDPAKYLPLR